MGGIRAILAEVLMRIKPSAAEKKETITRTTAFLRELNKRLRQQKVSAKAVLGGSFAKDTWIAGDYDIDIFVRFKRKHRDDDLSCMLEKALKPWKAERVHGSRDYFWVRDSVNFEIVPVLEIKDPAHAQNVTDFSPQHVAWVNTHGKSYKDDILLLKQFCKAHGVYGAENYIRGFSGHVVDLLTIMHKGFMPLLRAATRWKPKVVIDRGRIYKGKALMILNKSKTIGPLVLVDPVQPERNAAAALTQEKFDKFVTAAKAFIKKPDKAHFRDKGPDFERLAKKGHVLVVQARPLQGKADVVGTKLLKAFEHCKQALDEFGIVLADWRWSEKNKALMWFVLKTEKLPATMEWKGPPVAIKQHAAAFRKRYRNAWVRKARLYAKIKRRCPRARDALKACLAEKYMRHKARSWKLR